MATNISTSFDSLYLTAHLPEHIYISTDAQYIVITVSVDGDEVFRSIYYPYNRTIIFHDLRSIVEAAMYDLALDICRLEIEAREPSGSSAVIDDVYVIHSDIKMPQGSDAFINGSFLTTRKSAVIPRDGHLLLSYYVKAYQAASNYYLIHYKVPYSTDDVYEYKYTLSKYDSNFTMVKSVRYTYSTFKEMVETARGGSCTVCSVEIYLGGKSFTLFFTDEQPTEQFSFLNAFLVMETAYIYGTNTVKTMVDQSEAVFGRKTQFYDRQVTVKHEVETAALTPDEAQWLTQLLTSKWVSRQVSSSHSEQVLISDITSEVTDSDKDLTRLKFCWRYANGDEWLSAE